MGDFQHPTAGADRWWSSMLISSKKNNRRCKCQPIYLALLGFCIIALEIAFFYRQLVPLKVDLGDWSPVLPPPEPNTRDEEGQNFGGSGNTKNGTTKTTASSRRTMPTPDGMFNGYPIYYQSTTTTQTMMLSQIHCIGETNGEPYHWKRKKEYLDMNWATRSCQFHFLCVDLDTHEFVLRLPMPNNEHHQQHHHPDHTIFPPHWETQQTLFTNQSSQGHPFGVSIGGLNTKWTHSAFPRLKWFPRIDYVSDVVSDKDKDGHNHTFNFYALPANVTLIPFHSLAAFNPGHLVWDDFLPMFTLMQIFLGTKQVENDNDNNDTADPLFIRYQLPGDEGLWAGCDWRPNKQQECDTMLRKFGPMMVRNKHAIPITTQHNWNITFFRNNGNHQKRESNLVCAKQGLAGLGALTDHGVNKGHGWEARDYETSYNQGRGGQLWRFRNFLLSHLNVPGATTTEPPSGPPYRIVFSERSSSLGHRSLSFGPYVKALKEAAADDLDDIEILQVQMKMHSLTEQAEMVSRAAVYVTGCGGGAVTATFLPRGASLVVFYSQFGGVQNNKHSGLPARLDWDYFNNMAYARVHWITQLLPSKRETHDEEIRLFVELVRHELEIIRAKRKAYDAGDE